MLTNVRSLAEAFKKSLEVRKREALALMVLKKKEWLRSPGACDERLGPRYEHFTAFHRHNYWMSWKKF